jgi:hypothetical protein
MPMAGSNYVMGGLSRATTWMYTVCYESVSVRHSLYSNVADFNIYTYALSKLWEGNSRFNTAEVCSIVRKLTYFREIPKSNPDRKIVILTHVHVMFLWFLGNSEISSNKQTFFSSSNLFSLIAVAARPKTSTVLYSSNTDIVGSNPIRVMVTVCVSSVLAKALRGADRLSKQRPASDLFHVGLLLALLFNLEGRETRSSETSADFQQTALRYIPKDRKAFNLCIALDSLHKRRHSSGSIWWDFFLKFLHKNSLLQFNLWFI